MVNFYKNRKAFCSKILKSAVLSGSMFLFCFTNSLGEEVTPDKRSEKENRSSIVGLRSNNVSPVFPRNPDGTRLYNADTTLKGILKNQLVVTGTVRFITILRNMQKSYDDMATSDKNISFVDYPVTNVGTTNTGGFPVLEINVGTRVLKNFNFNVGYSFAHSFSGQADTNARNISSRQNLYFTGTYHTDIANININAGGILWTSLSRMTMGQPQYRDNYFERLPWNWYRQSFTMYDEYYSSNINMGSEALGRSPVQGFVGGVDFYKAGISVMSMFGRTNRNVIAANASNYFPSYLYAGRLEKSVFTRYVDGLFGFNMYSRSANTDRAKRVTDLNQVYSLDGKLRLRKVFFQSELAMGRIDNPKGQHTGYGFTFKTEMDKKSSPIPFSAEIYQIGYNLVSLDGGIINSNTSVSDGGYGTEFIYDNQMMINFAQEVNQIANNRRGVSLNGEFTLGTVKAILSVGASQELDNRSDTITVQHRVNSFSRSRFRPWFQAGGPYGRIKSGWRKTFETLTITDANSDYKKGFNQLELLLKQKAYLFGKDIVFLNFYNFNSIQDQASIIPTFTDKAFVRTLYGDLTIAYKLSKKYSVIGHAGVEKIMGGTRINLADAQGQTVKDAAGRPAYDPAGKTIDQTGYAFGVGIDYDFSNTAGLHLRHVWMNHKDKNFVNDVFRGQETTFELKLFF